VEKKIQPRLTGPVSGGVLFKVICHAQNPPAATRSGFLRWRAAKSHLPQERGEMRQRYPGCHKTSSMLGSPHRVSCGSSCAPAVEKKIQPRLTGPVSGGVLFKVICRAQNPPAAMRGGFLRWRATKWSMARRRNAASDVATAHPGYAGFFAKAVAPAVEKKIQPRLTGPVSGGVLFKLICRAQNPPAEMRGGFLRCGALETRSSLPPWRKTVKTRAPRGTPAARRGGRHLE
jgi:hypothetical protein